MRVVAALCWFDEPPELLDRCVRSLEGVADTVVALDGRWSLYPGAANVSADDQRYAIADAATDASLNVRSGTGSMGRPWGSQVEKRDMLMRIAANHGDWILVIDADDYVTESDGLADALDQTDLDVATITATWNIGKRGTSAPRRRLFRASAGVRVSGAHNGYRTADGRWLHGPPNVPTVPAADLSGALSINHDSSLRSTARMSAMISYYAERTRSGEETLRNVVFA